MSCPPTKEYQIASNNIRLLLQVKATSDTLKQIGPSTFVNFTRPIIRRLDVSVLSCYIKLYWQKLLYLRLFSLIGTVSTSPNLAKEERVARKSLLALRACEINESTGTDLLQGI